MSNLLSETTNENQTNLLSWLQNELTTFSKALQSIDQKKLLTVRNEIENVIGFLETLELIQDTLPSERLHESLRNSMRSIRKFCENIPRQLMQNLPNIPLDEKSGFPKFIPQAFLKIGPRYRLSQNGMALWIAIDSVDASFYSPQSIETWRAQSG